VVAVALFHTQHLVHHDLKPGNIFMDEELNAIVGPFSLCFSFPIYSFVGDFGEARSFSADHTGTITALGSMLYMAPEIVKNQKYLFSFLFLEFVSRLQTFISL
jgi:serine/threonine protein kinase